MDTALASGIALVETGQLQTVSNTLLTSAGLSVQFMSAPEPSTIALLGTGIAGVAGYGWRRRKAAVPAC